MLLKHIYRPAKAYIGGAVLKIAKQIEACLIINLILKTKKAYDYIYILSNNLRKFKIKYIKICF